MKVCNDMYFEMMNVYQAWNRMARVEGMGRHNEVKTFEINWGAYGNVDVTKAKEFKAQITEAIEIVDALNEAKIVTDYSRDAFETEEERDEWVEFVKAQDVNAVVSVLKMAETSPENGKALMRYLMG